MKPREKNCWGCGDNLSRSTEPGQEYERDGHLYCDQSCFWRGQSTEENPDYPIDYDAQDSRAASEERLHNLQMER